MKMCSKCNELENALTHFLLCSSLHFSFVSTAECPAGQYSYNGHVASSQFTQCTPCPNHFHQPASGQTGCIECPSDSTNNATKTGCQVLNCKLRHSSINYVACAYMHNFVCLLSFCACFCQSVSHFFFHNTLPVVILDYKCCHNISFR